jgi:predicted RecA/RadA family phage recombinase
MKNFVQNGKTIEVTLAAAILSGAAMLIGALVGVAVTSGGIGDVVAFELEGVFTLPKAVGAVSQGAILYWDDTAKNVTTSAASGANTKIGHAWASALSGDATIDVKLSR